MIKTTAISLFTILLIIPLLLTQCSNKRNIEKNKLKIGVILSLSGNGAVTGDNTLKGIQLAVQEQNAKGGLLGRQIELDIQDSKGVAATGLEQVQRMFNTNNKPFMVCTNTSDVSLAVKTETEKNKVILVASAATDKLLEGSNYSVRNYIESGQTSDDILEYLRDELRVNSTGIFYANTEFGNSINNKMKEKAGSYGITLPFDVAYDDKSLDYGRVITGQNTGAVSAIYVIGLGNSLGTFIKQLREAGYKGSIVADPQFNNPAVIAAAGSSATDVTFLDFDFDLNSDVPATKAFIAAYNNAFKTSPQNLAAITYDAVKIMFAGVEQAQSLDYLKIPKPTEAKQHNGVTGSIWVNGGNIIYPTTFKTQP
ncbi:hypothetical protein DJ568_01005 [Mucilaginibacter hurinus]|uniref:Leucine-binding protein domain-containing protein n=1 Tax=Mucilaginibacter hurinus TaxID=2201324 RepID=A0A367GTF5_9SPHI|nr:ABC transporter substrate-binding protein [Mucilaginibacter hurinus]RCH56468.1 hypothetical protein DJ568_01005 [Mucilaginibacter hurinus]